MFSWIIHEDNVLKYTEKNNAAKGGGVRQMLTRLTKGGWGVGEMLTMADKGGRRGLDPTEFIPVFFQKEGWYTFLWSGPSHCWLT